MDRRDVQSGIAKSWTAVQDLSLGETFSNPSPLGVNQEFRDLVLSEDVDYATIYLRGLSLSHYNFLLSDYSFFQFSWSMDNNVRYAYYPNPFATGRKNGIETFKRRRKLVEDGHLTQEEYLSLLHDDQAELRVPLIRYENAPGQHKGLAHPCSHFHIGHHGDNRWALNRILTPVAFTLLVLKQYYGNEWRILGEAEDDEYGNVFESMLINEKQLNCRIIGGELFVGAETRSFFFS